MMTVNQARECYKDKGYLDLEYIKDRRAYNTLFEADYTMKRRDIDGDIVYCIELERLNH